MSTEKILNRKDLKQPDEFISGTEKFLKYCSENKTITIGSIATVVLLALAFWGYSYNRDKQMQQMESLLFEMKQIGLDSDKKPSEMTSSYENFLKNFAEGPQKNRAKLLLADQYFRSSQPEKSEKIYRELMSQSKPSELIYDFAELGLGYSLELAKNLKDAVSVFKTLIARDGQSPLFQAYMSLARIYDADKDSKNALLILREMENKFPKHSEFGVIQDKIAALEKRA